MAKQAREHANSESCLDSDECGPAATCLAAIGGMGGDGALSCRQSRDCVPTAIALMRDELAKDAADADVGAIVAALDSVFDCP